MKIELDRNQLLQEFRPGTQQHQLADILSKRKTPIASADLHERLNHPSNLTDLAKRTNRKLKRYGLAVFASYDHKIGWHWSMGEVSK